MSTDGSYSGYSSEAVPRPPAQPPTPPLPQQLPSTRLPALIRWLRDPRPMAEPGVWRQGYEARPQEEPEKIGDRHLLGAALLSLLVGMLLWSLCWNGYIKAWLWPLLWFTPESWREAGGNVAAFDLASRFYYVLFGAALAGVCGHYGRWPRVWRRFAPQEWQRRLRPLGTALARTKPYVRAVVSLLFGVLVGLLCASGAWTFWLTPGWTVTPDDWHTMEPVAGLVFFNVYYLLAAALLLVLTALAGGWPALWRDRRGAKKDAQPWAPMPDRAPSSQLEHWPELRAAGYPDVADLLQREAFAGRVGDLDYVRIEREWRNVRSRPSALPEFAEQVLADGAAAYIHPSGDRDLAARIAKHDLLTGQVRIGTAVDEERNPYRYRGHTMGLDPSVLGTSLLAVGPPGSGKTGRIVRPVVEALCLQALSRQAAVVAVGTPRAGLGPDDAFDVILRLGDRRSTHDLDLYAGITEPDEAAGLLAEALLGAELGDTREATRALAQLLGPYQAAYGRFPTVRELRELLDDSPVALAELRQALDDAREFSQQRELDSRERSAARAGDLGRLLADRVSLLTRPAFDGFFGAGDGSAGQGPPPFSLSTLQHPIRVRIDLPDRGNAEASRILTRLVLAQFNASVTARQDRSLFAVLVLDDATHAITPDAVRGLRELRAANAGAVLTLRTLDEVPKRLRATLVGTVGCKIALSGVTTWDGEVFAHGWGEDWVKTEEHTHNPDFSGGLVKRALRGVRSLFTGVRATTTSVTVRSEQRARWSASDLAHKVPPGHGVLSLTSVRGEVGPPVLTRLGHEPPAGR
ncbi:ATP-binding protein [Streptomyces sp. XM4193]|uniref:ATP-binding protein n=1 Tax=Streptomyces sp. XM4193 TaxID=2929782 RepID=UPI001FFA4003|nr:ATP-binding protein [Streptomyces sp. XM4193]MCK1798865.1 ATP-binding protein [Streptomyces sp. XM4193]